MGVFSSSGYLVLVEVSEAKGGVGKGSNEIVTTIKSGAAAVAALIGTESGNDSEERNGDVEQASEEFGIDSKERDIWHKIFIEISGMRVKKSRSRFR